MNDQEIYQKIGKLLWSVMVDEAKIIFCEGDIYPEHNSYSFKWLTKNNQVGGFDFDKIPYEIGGKIIELLEQLRLSKIFKEKWTNFIVTLADDGKFNIEFAYIPEDDHWTGLYMKRVSDLKESELEEYNIPHDEWKKRVKLKEQNKN